MFKSSQEDVPFAVASSNATAIKVMAFVIVVLLLSLVGTGFFAAQQYARKEKTPEPIIFEVDKAAHKVVRVEKGTLNADQNSLLLSVSLRDYVFNRETINHIDEKDRWRKIRLMSSRSVWNDFQTVMNPEINKNSVLLNNDLERKIEVFTDYPISNNVHRVEFYVTDIIDGETYPAQRFVAVFKYSKGDAFVSFDDRFVNIEGLKITNYKIYGA